MKRTEKEAAQLVEIKYGEDSVTYRCSLCGDTVETTSYLKQEHKAMIQHARTCERNGGSEMKTDTELAVLPQQQEWRAIQLYDDKMIEQFARRIKKCVPNGSKLQDDEALALAQIAVSTDLSPFVGELFYIPGKGPHIGIEGLRRKASEQSTYSLAPPRAMDDEEIKEHGLKQGDVGRVAELYRHDVLAKAVEINKAAGEPVIPIRPVVGIGIWGKGEQVPKGKSPAWVASKRAEADALKKGFNIIIPFHENGEWLPVAEGEVVEAEVVRREAAVNAGRHDQTDGAAPADYGDLVAMYKNGEREKPPWVGELRDEIQEHPKASDALGSGNGMIQQLRVSAQRIVKAEQFRACVEIICNHALEEVTFGEAAVLMNKFVNGPDFEARVVSLLS